MVCKNLWTDFALTAPAGGGADAGGWGTRARKCLGVGGAQAAPPRAAGVARRQPGVKTVGQNGIPKFAPLN